MRDPELVKSAAKKFPGRVAVGLDARDGKVAVEGWAETSQVTALEIAQRFEDAGVAAIIFTDIARDGLLKGLNLDATVALAERISIPVIASGGFASIDDVKALLAPRAKKFPGRVAVGLDARDGKVAVDGWAETSQVTALEIAQRFEDAGVAAIIFTDIARDGLLKGLNLDATIALAERISIPVIASGGFASLDDVKALLQPRAKKLAGSIAGRALYDGRLDPAAALALIRNARAAA